MSELKFTPRPFTITETDLLPEHDLIDAWVTAALSSCGDRWYLAVELKSLAEGKEILASDPPQAVRIVRAAITQLSHWDHEASLARQQASEAGEWMNVHRISGWSQISGTRCQIVNVLSSLMRRNLPFAEADIVLILNCCNQAEHIGVYFGPIGAIVRLVERHAKTETVGEDFKSAATQFASTLRASTAKKISRLATLVEQALAAHSPTVGTGQVDVQPLVRCAAGNKTVLVQLKQHLGLLPHDDVTSDVIPIDGFALRADSPLRDVHALITALLGEVIGRPGYHSVDLEAHDAGRRMLAIDARSDALMASLERDISAVLFRGGHDNNWQARYAAISVANRMTMQPCTLDRDSVFDLLLHLSARPNLRAILDVDKLTGMAEQMQQASPLTEGERYVLALFRDSLVTGPLLGTLPRTILRLNQLIADGAGFYLCPAEEWSRVLNEDIHALPTDQKARWIALLKHWLTATAARPSERWLKTCATLVKEATAKNVQAKLLHWLSHVHNGRATKAVSEYVGDTRGSGDVIEQENANCLRGMLWTLPAFKSSRDEVARVIAGVAQSAYRKVPGVGPRAVKVGNAAVYALSEIGTTNAVGQLAMLKVRVKFGTAQKEIEKAFDTAAEKLKLDRDQIEEMGVPSYGLEEVGKCVEQMGEYRAEIIVDGSDASIHFFDKNNKELKSVPSKVKTDFKAELKELKQSAADISAMLPAQRDRIDSLFLMQKQWTFPIWQERYLNHPLVGTISRRLIWKTAGTNSKSFVYQNDAFVDADGNAVRLDDEALIELWHPIECTPDVVIAWRNRLAAMEIRQPFKQAHREVYVLTDAERRTNTYSNRFAAHIIRQHQFNALCAARGWKNRLRLLVDDSYPPATRHLPQWDLRAEFWIEGIGDNYGTDSNESGVYLRLATDQVRFHRPQSASNWAHAGGGGYTTQAAGPGQANINDPLPLDQIPPLVLSEILRDVDLFVGVASVGNDPTWQDGGPGGRYQTYWQSYSFGDLGETAKTRRAVLETLLPRMTKIKGKWTLSDKFLIITGALRTYKIHLGSGNILMEPNDQYLCIVPGPSDRRSDDSMGEKILLPFEGDRTLSIILSKALLLADDTKIKDSTITRQINLR